MIYINGTGTISPQLTTDNSRFLEEPLWFESNRLKCADPNYRDFIPADQIRRMGRIIRMGIAAAKLCLADAATGCGATEPPAPEAIITGTGLGCIEDTEKFLASMIRNREEFLTPTSFIQSTHNTVAGQIALMLKCHGYNFTFVHRGISFESALTDAMMQLETGAVRNVLAGGTDELTDNSFAIMTRLGFWKRKPVLTRDLFSDRSRGSVAGEGSAFFFLEKEKTAGTYAGIKGLTMFTGSSEKNTARDRIFRFLERHGVSPDAIDLLLMGFSGDPRYDGIYHEVSGCMPGAAVAGFKHLCGEYHTASAFATWLASMILRRQSVPDAVMPDRTPGKLDYILIYNNYRGNNHALILLNRP